MSITNRSKRQTNKRCATKITVLILASVIFAVLASFVVLGQKESLRGESTIRMAAILFRHGEKNPTDFYPNDPHAKRDWPGGPGALTMRGSQQAYNFGKNLRLRYESLLPKDGIYSQENMLVRSSYAERCIMSAQAMLAGFMPPSEGSTKLPLHWQPVPVTSIPRKDDTLIAQKKPCFNYEVQLKEALYDSPSPELAELNAENSDLYQKLTELTGKKMDDIVKVEYLYNTLKTEEEMGLELPEWTKGIYPERLMPIVERSYRIFTETDLMKRIKGGAFISEVYGQMASKANKTLKPDRNLFFYSGHDVTLVNVMNSMGILNQTSTLPDFTSALVFELHESTITPGTYEVKVVYYHDSTDSKPTTVNLLNCSSPCSLEGFKASISHLLFEDYHEVCNNPPSVRNC